MKKNKKIKARKALATFLLLCMLTPIVLLYGSAFAEEPIAPIETETGIENALSSDSESETTQEPTLAEEPTPIPTQEPTPTEVVSPYKITFTTPKNWTGAASATVKIRVADKQSVGWHKVELKFKGSDWLELSDRFIDAQDDKINFDVSDNGSLFVRVTDTHGNEFIEEACINCFDRTPPTVTAGVDDLLLRVEAIDAQSGVAGIQVNGLLFTTLENGVLNVRIEEVLMQYEKLAIRAVDYAGNFSAPVTLDNPYYAVPVPEATPTPTPEVTPVPTAEPTVAPTTEPTATPKPTKKPSSGGSGNQATATPEVTAAPIILPTADPNTQAAQVTTLPEPVTNTEYITLGPGKPFKAESNMNTLDLLYSSHTNKQFITVQTRNGDTFFIIIDYDKPIDEEADLYETYFLNLVDERDLLALLSQEELPVATPTPIVIIATPEPTAVPVATATPNEPAKAADNGSMSILLVAVIVLAGGGAYLFMQSKKGNSHKKPMLDDDPDEDEEEGEYESSEQNE